MTRRRQKLVAAGALGLLALWFVSAPQPGHAQMGSCRSACWQAYGQCYKSTGKRKRCQAQLQRCLDGCIRSRRR